MTVVDYEGEWKCIDLECTHWDGDRCTLGFCDPGFLSLDIEEYPVDYNIPLHDNKNNVSNTDT